MSANLFRRCGCRDDAGRQYGVLPDLRRGQKWSAEQLLRACPKMVADPKHGRWSYRLSAGVDPITKKRRPQVNGRSFVDKVEAAQALAEDQAKLARGTYVKPSRKTLAEWLPEWIARRQRTDKALRPTSLANYRRYIEQDIAPSFLGRLPIEDIRRGHILMFVDDLADAGRGAVTIRRIVAVVQGALSAAVKAELIESSPAAGLGDDLPATEAKHFQPWEPEQISHFLEVAAELRLGPLFDLAMLTGMRRGELVALMWSNVDLRAGRLRVWDNETSAGRGRTKTEAGMRVLDLSSRSVSALTTWRLAQEAEREAWGPGWQTEGHVFTYEDGRALKPQYVTRLFDKIRVKAGLPEMTMHGTRHTNASLLIAAGVDIAVVSKLLGHSSVAVTSDIYGHLIGSVSRDAANAVAALVPTTRATVHTLHTQGGDEQGKAASA